MGRQRGRAALSSVLSAVVRVVAFGYTLEQPSSAEVPMRLIRLAVILSLIFAPLVAEVLPLDKLLRAHGSSQTA
jgi:flagellar biosynthesis protein FliR